MHVITDLNEFPSVTCGLTIGNFDGVHLGHQSILHELRKRLSPQEALAVFTFSNHPTHVLSPLTPLPLIYTLEHKLKVLSEQNVDYTILVPFTAEFANTPYDLFLTRLKQQIPFKHLILGQGSKFGKNKEGNEANVRKIASQLDFQVDYLPKLELAKDQLSSGHIRTLIAEGHLSQVNRCLGRPYSLYAPLHRQHNHHVLHVPHLCLPPTAIYPVQLKLEGSSYLGRAHIDRPHSSIRVDVVNHLPILITPPMAELIFLHD